MSTLYVVGTPIGNLGDLSPRAVEILNTVDFIAAEDTRVTLKLLNHFSIRRPLLSYYEHNAAQQGPVILRRLLEGESCAIVTDAGMPCISDPGEQLVALCAEHNVPVVVVPGPSAVISALAISGLSTSRFSFEGFLSVKKSSRYEHLEQIKTAEQTLIFYEAPHKLLQTLRDLLEALGDRRISLCRELTKLHEEVLRTTLSEAISHFEQTEPKGEFVLVVEGAKKQAASVSPMEDALTLLRQYLAEGLSVSEAAKQTAKQTGLKKGDLYKAAIAAQTQAE